jgi:hypothetical protein
MNMCSRTLATLILTAALPLTACVGVNTISLYKASLATGSDGVIAADGVAFATGQACIHVADRGAEIRTIAARDYDAPKNVFRVAIWIVLERSIHGLTYTPNQLRLSYVDGSKVIPQSIQVSRFLTRWEEEKTLILKPDEFERIARTDHQPKQSLLESSGPVDLWDWTRLIVEFPRPSEASAPYELTVGALQQNDQRVPTPLVRFERLHESRLVFPGTAADGIGVWDAPYKICRKLQARSQTIPIAK